MMKKPRKKRKKERVDVQACLDRAFDAAMRALSESGIFEDEAEGKSKSRKKPKGKSGCGLSDKE